jgi:predicted GNAT family acetyltransferase
MDGTEIIHQTARHRFVISIAGGERGGFLDYRPLAGGVWDLTYTFVPRQDRGGGVGRALVLHVLAHAREHGLRVVPTCGFVGTVIEENPEYLELVTTADRSESIADRSESSDDRPE